MSESVDIRIATPADAEALAALAERTFRDTFAADNAAGDMEAYVGESFSPDRVRAELADGANTFLLAFVGGRHSPAGYAKLRTGTAEPEARDAGHRTLWLGVWERNARAIAFYEQWGYAAVGEHLFRLGSNDQRDLIMERPVATKA
jgi:ribosomal protein S18 acetylase RimI-like enzyme